MGTQAIPPSDRTPPPVPSKEPGATRAVSAEEARRYVSQMRTDETKGVTRPEEVELTVPRPVRPTKGADPSHPLPAAIFKDVAQIPGYLNAYGLAHGLDIAHAPPGEPPGNEYRDEVENQMPLINVGAASFVREMCLFMNAVREATAEAQLAAITQAMRSGTVALQAAQTAGDSTTEAMNKQGVAGIVGGTIGLAASVGITVGSSFKVLGSELKSAEKTLATELQRKAASELGGAPGLVVGRGGAAAGAVQAPVLVPGGGAPGVAAAGGGAPWTAADESKLKGLTDKVAELRKEYFQKVSGMMGMAQGITQLSGAVGSYQAAEPQGRAARLQGFQQGLFSAMNQNMKSAENEAQAYSQQTQAVAQAMSQLIKAGFIA